MRLKTYSAPTMSEAMELVRLEMGDDAVIVSTQKGADGQGARVVAAIEELPIDEAAICERPEDEKIDVVATIRQALTYHGAPSRLIDRLVDAADDLNEEDPIIAFAGAVDASFVFEPLAEPNEGRLTMLVGPPGVGKTITTAKLAARAALSSQPVEVITTDTRRAGGVEQLEAFTRILDLNLKTADTVKELGEVVKALRGSNGASSAQIIIDTQGTNPFSDTEMDHLKELIKVSGAEPVLVLAAGGDAFEMADTAASFAAIGVKRLLLTRLDIARRLGGILAAADAARMAFCNVSITPHVSDGLSPINPVSLARLIMPYSPNSVETPCKIEAA